MKGGHMNHEHEVGGGTLELLVVNDVNGDGKPNLGDSISFNVIVPDGGSWESVNVEAFQNGVAVYGGYIWAQQPGVPLRLGSATWQSGAADAVAKLRGYNGKKSGILATLSFHVEA